MKKFLKDKKGNGMLVFFFLVFVIALMLYMYQTNTTRLILERSRLYTLADEAANKAAWEIYQYQSQNLNTTGQIDVNLLQAAANKAVEFFKSKGYTLQNASAHLEGKYLVITGDVVTKYKEPVLPGKRQVLVRSGYYTNNYLPQTGYNQSVNVYGTGPWGVIQNWKDSNAKWIWGVENVGAYWFKQSFTLSKPQTVTITATADDVFTLYVDGKQVLSGNNWRTGYSTSIFLPAGTHEVKAYVQNLYQGQPAASFSFTTSSRKDNPGAFIASIADSNGNVILHTDETWQLSQDGQDWQDVGMIAPKNMPLNYSSLQWVDTSHYELRDAQPGNNYVVFSIEGRAALRKINK